MASPDTTRPLTEIINGPAAEQYVCLAEQRSNRLLVFHRSHRWNDPDLLWQFTPSDTRWSNLSDIRFRRHDEHGIVGLLTASGGSAGILRVTAASAQDSTDLVWTAQPGGNPHAIELIPTTGTIVTASSAGHLNVYAPTTPDQTARQTQTVELPGAHGLLWSPSQELLWAIGDGVLLSFAMSGTGTHVLEPTGTRVELPGMGHDLQPDYHRTGSLLVTDTKAIYRVNPTTLSTTVIADIPSVKSYVHDSSGAAIWLQARGEPPRPWSSPIVSFDSGSTEHPDGQVYKARLLRCDYE